ncbi:replication initiator [Phytoactinopolyspora mesophila]|uniref:Replication initiation protein n=1 Tax=Phytoactinopolyspora mesophila TaxID=2650750 RepID=A0A7K3M8Y4_9ACTN|nr:replication initiator [Phytoactinopolyspora mesophila]NDL58878.1 replication initiation protein [Phytoactinopolyspora mesophila]
MTTPTLDDDTIRGLAVAEKVCVRPILSKLTDTETGDTRTVLIPCGATREQVCPSCADRARRLRMQQCREGWHLSEEPTTDNDESQDDDDTDEDQGEGDGDGAGEGGVRRVRSTRRRDDADDLPRPPKQHTTLGRSFDTPDGKTYRPSMFLTLTMPSYGRVTREGVPVDPGSYDYRQAALDALHFPKLIDRFWQNLRRATGVPVQYFATVEPQRRLAPHLHAAVRGTFPRALIRQVVTATYHQLWWPSFDEPAYVDRLPVWDEHACGYVDPDTGASLPTWDEALDQLDAHPDAEPAHVVRFGTQIDMQGILAGTPAADRRVGYLTKYLTKNIADDLNDDGEVSAARQAHIDRIADEVRWLPCAPTCAHWLRFGVQPKNTRPGQVPGLCRSKAHDRDHLGLGGRRVLVSRKWTGKTLTEHKADRAAIVRTVLEDAGIDMDDHGEFSATATRADGLPRYVWSPVRPGEADAPSYLRLIAHAINRRQAWREQYEQAKQRAGPPDPNLSATIPGAATAA